MPTTDLLTPGERESVENIRASEDRSTGWWGAWPHTFLQIIDRLAPHPAQVRDPDDVALDLPPGNFGPASAKRIRIMLIRLTHTNAEGH